MTYLTKGDAWLLSDRRQGSSSSAAYQFARLRGLATHEVDLAAGGVPCLQGGRRTLVALGLELLSHLPPAHLQILNSAVRDGATLYLRGGQPGHRVSLEPFCKTNLELVDGRGTRDFRLAAHRLVPRALAEERFTGVVGLISAAASPPELEPLAFVIDPDGRERPFLFALELGSGAVIVDLMPNRAAGDPRMPIEWRMADSALLAYDLGALIAVDRAAGRDQARLPPMNVVIDDRPISYDYGNAGRLRRWLEHMKRICPAVHVDFAWIPDQLHPSRSYVQTLKDFDAGFIWHGLRRHVDHRTLTEFDRELAQGETMVRRISKSFGVKIQRVMVFPFERANYRALKALKDGSFKTCLESSDPCPRLEGCAMLGFMRDSTALHDSYAGVFPMLRRYSGKSLTRRWMLAKTALGLPLIVAGHPHDIGLRRLSALRNGGSPGYFDSTLQFAAEKGMQGRPLEAIADEYIRE